MAYAGMAPSPREFALGGALDCSPMGVCDYGRAGASRGQGDDNDLRRLDRPTVVSSRGLAEYRRDGGLHHACMESWANCRSGLSIELRGGGWNRRSWYPVFRYAVGNREL